MFIAVLVTTVKAHAGCRVTPVEEEVRCPCVFEDDSYIEQPFNQLPLCEQIVKRGYQNPIIKMEAGENPKRPYALIDAYGNVIASGVYLVDEERLLSFQE